MRLGFFSLFACAVLLLLTACAVQAATPAITVEKVVSVGGGSWAFADSPPGPSFYPGGPAPDVSYAIENTGDVVLANLQLTDTVLGPITLPTTTLNPGLMFSVTVAGTWVRGQNTSTATVTASYNGQTVSASDPANWYGALPSIGIETRTSGQDADAAPGPYLLVGSPVTWTYIVTNTGDAFLTNVAVTDDHGVIVSAPKTSLAAGESMTATASGTAVAGQYANTGTVTGTPPAGPAVTASDPTHYFGATPGIQIEAQTNGDDADTVPGPYLLVDGIVTWTYRVTNTGNVPLSSVGVVDDSGTASDPTDDFTASLVGGDTNGDLALDSTETWTFRAVGPVRPGQHANTARVSGTPPGGLAYVTATDPSHYFGAAPGIQVEARTNGEDADTAPGPYVNVGSPVTWTYTMTNTGNVALTSVSLTDDVGGSFGTVLFFPPGGIVIYPWSGTAVAGQHANTATVTGTPPGGLADVTATDPSHYYGNSAPVVDAGADITGTTDVPVAFAGAFTDPGDPGAHAVAWAFGDGGTAAGSLTPSRAYAANGTYTATLTVTDAGNLAGTDTLTVTVRDPPPAASFTANATTGTAPLTVAFHDASTGFIHNRAWDFGDGGTSTVADPVHTYAMPGTYAVRLTVTNGGGADTAGATISALAPVASFVAEPDAGEAPLTVAFTDTSMGGPTSWQWEFGDGGTSVQQHPEYTYLQPGTYTVTLAIIAPAGMARYQATVVVGEAHTPAPTPTVTVTPTPPAVVPLPGSGMPTDPDDDGRYEDVNGNGVADFADIVLYFQQMAWIAANEPLAVFDFNGNGSIDFADLVWLFNHL